jgi:hypothetical protein
MSNTYERFVREYLGATSYERRDGVPIEILDELTSEEREEAEAELIKRLDTNDSWSAIGLGHIKSTRAVPKLYDLLPKASGPVKAQIATALWRICEDGNMLQIVLDLSQPSTTSRLSPFYEFNLIDIIHCLAQFPQPEGRARLEELTADKRHLVSYNAKRALALRKSLYNFNT